MNWIVPKIWENGEVWILGGGPSVPKQFGIPDDVVKKVISGELNPSAYSSYMEGIHNKHVIGINVSYLIGDWIDMVYFGDCGFFTKHQLGLSNFPGLKVSSHPQMEKVPWIKFIPRDLSRRWGISTKPNLIVWNGNSGGAAISIAANAGAKRIILVGFDMKLDNTKMQHWHNLYHKGPIDDRNIARVKKLPFEKHKIGFRQISIDAQKRGIEIINASPDSAIMELPKVPVKDLL